MEVPKSGPHTHLLVVPLIPPGPRCRPLIVQIVNHQAHTLPHHLTTPDPAPPQPPQHRPIPHVEVSHRVQDTAPLLFVDQVEGGKVGQDVGEGWGQGGARRLEIEF